MFSNEFDNDVITGQLELLRYARLSEIRPLKNVSKAWIHVLLRSVLHAQYYIPAMASFNLYFLKAKFWLKEA